MPRLSPFRGVRYTQDAGSSRDLLAPPYDVIGPALAAELRGRSPRNAVRLVLPEGEGDERYAEAARLLELWNGEGMLAEDASPAVYVYRQGYRSGGKRYERLSLFAALALETPGEGVLPHERTHAGPKRDRLALTLATNTQLSPIFLLARDPGAALLEALRAATTGEPVLHGVTPDGIEHTMWIIDEEGAAEVFCALAGRHPLLIADGHHRYETALEVADRIGSEAAGHVLACIVSDSDPGLTIRSTHRTITRLDEVGIAAAELPDRLAEWFEVTRLGRLGAEEAARVAAVDPGDLVVVPGGEEAYRLRPRSEADDSVSRGERAALGLGVVQFDRHVMGDLFGVEADEAAHAGWLEYHRDATEAVERSRPDGAAFLVPPVTLAAVWSATSEGIRLPPKSTYFEPKIPSGLLFRPI